MLVCVGGGILVFHAPAGTVDGDDVAVVEVAVEDGGGEDFVGEDLSPFAEGLVAGDDDGAFLVAAGDGKRAFTCPARDRCC